MEVNLNFNTACLRFYDIEKLEINVLSKTSFCCSTHGTCLNSLPVDARDYSLEKFKKHVAGTVCNTNILLYDYLVFIPVTLNFKASVFNSA